MPIFQIRVYVRTAVHTILEKRQPAKVGSIYLSAYFLITPSKSRKAKRVWTTQTDFCTQAFTRVVAVEVYRNSAGIL